MAIVAKINTGGTIGRATITTPRSTGIVSQNFKPKPNVAMAEIIDVTVDNLQNNSTLIYNSVTSKYEARAIVADDIILTKISGGTF